MNVMSPRGDFLYFLLVSKVMQHQYKNIQLKRNEIALLEEKLAEHRCSVFTANHLSSCCA